MFCQIGKSPICMESTSVRGVRCPSANAGTCDIISLLTWVSLVSETIAIHEIACTCTWQECGKYRYVFGAKSKIRHMSLSEVTNYQIFEYSFS